MSSPCTHLPGKDECMHACMLPELLHVQEFELPITIFYSTLFFYCYSIPSIFIYYLFFFIHISLFLFIMFIHISLFLFIMFIHNFSIYTTHFSNISQYKIIFNIISLPALNRITLTHIFLSYLHYYY